MRETIIALGFGVALAVAGSATAAPYSYHLDTNFGPLTLTIDPATGGVTGSYPKFQGRIVGMLGEEGRTIRGTWFQPTADEKCGETNGGTDAWGNVAFKFPRQPEPGDALKGAWGYCRAVPTETWEGTFR